MENLRTFIAIDITPTDNLLDDWEELKELLRWNKIKWVDNRLLHLTLFFLGETPEIKIDTIIQTLNKTITSFKPFNLTINGFGSFGNNASPKVIWVGLEKSKELSELKESINSILFLLGFEEEQKDFSPHITLGRVKEMKPSSELKKFIQGHKDKVYFKATINQVVFYQSILKPEGPIYKPIKVFKLPSP